MKESDLPAIIALLSDDFLGQIREKKAKDAFSSYLSAFHEIDKDLNQYLMIVESNDQILGTCHLTLLPSLTYCGSMRMQIEAVRIHKDFRNLKIGEAMISEAIKYAKSKHVCIIQLTCNYHREKAIKFYQKMRFEPTHAGFKMHIN